MVSNDLTATERAVGVLLDLFFFVVLPVEVIVSILFVFARAYRSMGC